MSTQHPIRTCIGCRQRATATELLRVVVAPEAIRKAAQVTPALDVPGVVQQSVESGALSVVPDPRCRFPGRGAWVHRNMGCVELAQRRRAFGRALRVSDPVDPAPVCEYVAQAEQGRSSATPPAEHRRR